MLTKTGQLVNGGDGFQVRVDPPTRMRRRSFVFELPNRHASVMASRSRDRAHTAPEHPVASYRYLQQ